MASIETQHGAEPGFVCMASTLEQEAFHAFNLYDQDGDGALWRRTWRSSSQKVVHRPHAIG